MYIIYHIKYKKTLYIFQRIYIRVGAGPVSRMRREGWSGDRGCRGKIRK